MLKGDISKLATMCGCSKSTIYKVAEKLGIDLHPIRYRCDKTVDSLPAKLLRTSRQNGYLTLLETSSSIAAKRKSERSAIK